MTPGWAQLSPSDARPASASLELYACSGSVSQPSYRGVGDNHCRVDMSLESLQIWSPHPFLEEQQHRRKVVHPALVIVEPILVAVEHPPVSDPVLQEEDISQAGAFGNLSTME